MADRDDRLLAACYREHGKSAQYVALDGTTTPCRIMFIRAGNPRMRSPIEPVSFGGLQMPIAEGKQDILVRVSEIAQPEAGGVFNLLDANGQPIAGESYRLGEAPMLSDVTRKEWRCPVPFGEPE